MATTGKSWQHLLPIMLLSAAGFTVLTTEFIIVGLLPAVAKDLHVSIPQAGLLVTLFAFTVAAVGPPLTAHLSQFERKRLFVIALLLFALSNALAATAQNFEVMAFARFIPAMALPVFWSLASDTAVQIMGHERAGKAISMVGFGVVLATIFGIPIGTLISHAYGWRTAFGILAVLALVKSLSLLVFLPKTALQKEPMSVAKQMSILRDPTVMGHVLLSMLLFAGMFTAYTYLADPVRVRGSRRDWQLARRTDGRSESLGGDDSILRADGARHRDPGAGCKSVWPDGIGTNHLGSCAVGPIHDLSCSCDEGCAGNAGDRCFP
jgi:predicted MFS family arabinose efflux permease